MILKKVKNGKIKSKERYKTPTSHQKELAVKKKLR